MLYRPERFNDAPCGIHIKNVSLNDRGYWRLRSYRNKEIMQGIAFVDIIEEEETYQPSEEKTYTPEEIFYPDETKYCYVYRDDINLDSPNYEFPQHGKCMIPELGLDPKGSGQWNVKIGVNHQIREIETKIEVTSKGEVFRYVYFFFFF